MEQKAKMNKVKFVGSNNGFTIRKNGLVDLKIECDGSQLARVLMLLQYANDVFAVCAKTQDGNVVLGKEFNFKSLNIDRDGETKIALESDKDSVSLSSIEDVYKMTELVTFVFYQRENAD